MIAIMLYVLGFGFNASMSTQDSGGGGVGETCAFLPAGTPCPPLPPPAPPTCVIRNGVEICT